MTAAVLPSPSHRSAAHAMLPASVSRVDRSSVDAGRGHRFAPPPGSAPAHRRVGVVLAIALGHVALLWTISKLDVLQISWQEVTPLMVALIQSETPPLPTPAPALPVPAARTLPVAPLITPPAVVVAVPVALVEPAIVTDPLPTSPEPAVVAQALAIAPPQPPAAPPAPVPPKLVPATSVRYLVPPAIEVPLASRRLGESGTVLLRVLVDVKGLPRQVSVHRSSGFARLDEQALAAMRQARFQPQTDNGIAVEWLVIAPLQYEID